MRLRSGVIALTLVLGGALYGCKKAEEAAPAPAVVEEAPAPVEEIPAPVVEEVPVDGAVAPTSEVPVDATVPTDATAPTTETAPVGE